MSMFPTRVLLATDGSEDAALAARAAVDLSQPAAAELHVAHVWHIPVGAWPAIPDMYSSYYELLGEETLAEQVEDIEQLGGEVAESHLRCRAAVADEILYLAREVNAGLIVMGSRGAGRLRRLATGSVSEGVVHHAHLPVLMLRGGENAWPPRHVVAGEDGSEPAGRAQELAAQIGRLFDCTMTLVRTYPELPEVYEEGRRMDPRMTDDELRRAEKELGGRAGDLEAVLGRRPRISIGVGDAAEDLVASADARNGGSTLLAVGSRGLGPIKRIRMGSVSTKVMRAAGGPVLIYPPDA
ncbi:MAG: universal stress protein [Rubrobacteraceae bacterium]